MSVGAAFFASDHERIAERRGEPRESPAAFYLLG
jgi:hypothetical protein